MRKWLALIFLTIFSFQVLPVKSIGKLLAKGQTEEEVKHGCSSDDDSDPGLGKFNDLICYSFTDQYTYTIRSKNKVADVHFADDLPASHITEIPSPPPNC